MVTSLFPSGERPTEGIFALRRWSGMRQRGHSVEVIHPQPYAPWPLGGRYAEIRRRPAREELDGIPVHRPRYLHLPGRVTGNARRFADVASREIDRPDVVVCDYAWPASELAPLLARRSIPCVVSGRGSDVLEVAGEAGLRPELARNLQSARHWCGVSQDLVVAMDELGGIQGRGMLVPNGVDADVFAPRDRRDCRIRLGLPRDPVLILVVGHLIPRKEPQLALDAFARLGDQSAMLAFIGRGPLEAELRRLVTARGVSDRVLFVAEMSPEDLAIWIGASDALLLTSWREGRPNIVLEGLSAGRPVIATDAGGIAEILPSDLLVRTRDPDDIAATLERSLAAAPRPLAMRRAVEHLTWDASLAALESCLASAVADSGRVQAC